MNNSDLRTVLKAMFSVTITQRIEAEKLARALMIYDFLRGHGYHNNGCHESFSLGFMHFCWANGWCQRCFDNA